MRDRLARMSTAHDLLAKYGPDPGPAAFGRWLADAMTARGYDLDRGSQARFVADSGVNQGTVSRALRGITVPGIGNLGLIAKALNVRVSPLLILCGYLPPEADETGRPTSTQEALHALGVHDPEHQRLVLDLIRALTEGPRPG